MAPVTQYCQNCGSGTEIRAYRKFVLCPYCGTREPFIGFPYQKIDWRSSMYDHVKLWMDCPACRSANMYLGPSGRMWKCPDCGYTISKWKKNMGIFWFCDDCEAFLNVQEGFTTKHKSWKCTECGYVSDVSRSNII